MADRGAFQILTPLRACALSALLAFALSACGSGHVEGTYDDLQKASDGGATSKIEWHLIDLVFPVVGEHRYTNDWHTPRDSGRKHLGTDILAKKMVPVVAIADGVVAWVRANSKKGGECCYLAIDHESRGFAFQSRYIHLNNDSPGTDDGKKIGIARGIRKGVRVRAGQLIGWVGDSGNAEGTTSHLHLEIRDEYLRAVNPYRLLKNATRIADVIGATTETESVHDDFAKVVVTPNVEH